MVEFGGLRGGGDREGKGGMEGKLQVVLVVVYFLLFLAVAKNL